MKVFTNKRKINAPAEKIFNAFEDPRLLSKWWGPNGFTNTFNLFEFKPEGKWTFVMHGPDGVDYQNYNYFVEIEKPNKLVIRHDCNPYFTLTVSIESSDDSAVITWNQDFDSEEVAEKIAHIIAPANEQNLDKLQELVLVS